MSYEKNRQKKEVSFHKIHEAELLEFVAKLEIPFSVWVKLQIKQHIPCKHTHKLINGEWDRCTKCGLSHCEAVAQVDEHNRKAFNNWSEIG